MRLTRTLAVAARLGLGLGLSFGASACEPRKAPPPPASAPSTNPGPETAQRREDPLTPTFVEAEFVQTYQAFILPGLLNEEKTALWSRYYQGRWVRWIGQLAMIKDDRLLFRHVQQTLTFDVSLTVDRGRQLLTQPGNPLQVGRFYGFVGRMVRFDDRFRLFYLDQGSLILPDALGVPGTLAERPPSSRRPPAPPKVIER